LAIETTKHSDHKGYDYGLYFQERQVVQHPDHNERQQKREVLVFWWEVR